MPLTGKEEGPGNAHRGLYAHRITLACSREFQSEGSVQTIVHQTSLIQNILPNEGYELFRWRLFVILPSRKPPSLHFKLLHRKFAQFELSFENRRFGADCIGGV